MTVRLMAGVAGFATLALIGPLAAAPVEDETPPLIQLGIPPAAEPVAQPPAAETLAAQPQAIQPSAAPQAARSAKDDGFPARVFAGKLGKGKSYACFVRHYDADHLAQHPQQKVAAMKLLVKAEKDAETQVLGYSFSLNVKFRNRAGWFESGGGCGRMTEPAPNGEKFDLGCGVDCDGGGVSLELVKNDAAAMLRLSSVRVWRTNSGPEEGIVLEAGADDAAFRLDRTSLKDCGPLVDDPKERAAMLRR